VCFFVLTLHGLYTQFNYQMVLIDYTKRRAEEPKDARGSILDSHSYHARLSMGLTKPTVVRSNSCHEGSRRVLPLSSLDHFDHYYWSDNERKANSKNSSETSKTSSTSACNVKKRGSLRIRRRSSHDKKLNMQQHLTAETVICWGKDSDDDGTVATFACTIGDSEKEGTVNLTPKSAGTSEKTSNEARNSNSSGTAPPLRIIRRHNSHNKKWSQQQHLAAETVVSGEKDGDNDGTTDSSTCTTGDGEKDGTADLTPESAAPAETNNYRQTLKKKGSFRIIRRRSSHDKKWNLQQHLTVDPVGCSEDGDDDNSVAASFASTAGDSGKDDTTDLTPKSVAANETTSDEARNSKSGSTVTPLRIIQRRNSQKKKWNLQQHSTVEPVFCCDDKGDDDNGTAASFASTTGGGGDKEGTTDWLPRSLATTDTIITPSSICEAPAQPGESEVFPTGVATTAADATADVGMKEAPTTIVIGAYVDNFKNQQQKPDAGTEQTVHETEPEEEEMPSLFSTLSSPLSSLDAPTTTRISRANRGRHHPDEESMPSSSLAPFRKSSATKPTMASRIKRCETSDLVREHRNRRPTVLVESNDSDSNDDDNDDDNSSNKNDKQQEQQGEEQKHKDWSKPSQVTVNKSKDKKKSNNSKLKRSMSTCSMDSISELFGQEEHEEDEEEEKADLSRQISFTLKRRPNRTYSMDESLSSVDRFQKSAQQQTKTAEPATGSDDDDDDDDSSKSQKSYIPKQPSSTGGAPPQPPRRYLRAGSMSHVSASFGFGVPDAKFGYTEPGELSSSRHSQRSLPTTPSAPSKSSSLIGVVVGGDDGNGPGNGGDNGRRQVIRRSASMSQVAQQQQQIDGPHPPPIAAVKMTAQSHHVRQGLGYGIANPYLDPRGNNDDDDDDDSTLSFENDHDYSDCSGMGLGYGDAKPDTATSSGNNAGDNALGYELAVPDTEDLGYGDARPDFNTMDRLGYGKAVPDAEELGYGKANPHDSLGYSDAKPDLGYGDARPDCDLGYGDAHAHADSKTIGKERRQTRDRPNRAASMQHVKMNMAGSSKASTLGSGPDSWSVQNRSHTRRRSNSINMMLGMATTVHGSCNANKARSVSDDSDSDGDASVASHHTSRSRRQPRRQRRIASMSHVSSFDGTPSSFLKLGNQASKRNVMSDRNKFDTSGFVTGSRIRRIDNASQLCRR